MTKRMETNILEPCCYVRQLHNILENASDGFAYAFHFGDVLAKHFIDRVGVRGKIGSAIYLALPDIEESTVDEIRKLLSMKSYDDVGKINGCKFPKANILTRKISNELTGLASEFNTMGKQRVNLAIDKGLSFQLVGFKSNKESLIITGSLGQSALCGANLVEIISRPDMCASIFGVLDSELRVHRTPL